MNLLKTLCPILIALLIFSCSKEKKETVTVVRDCSGTYLRLNDKDYHVCNTDQIAAVENGASIKVDFSKIQSCSGSEGQVICAIVHKNEGWIKIQKVY